MVKTSSGEEEQRAEKDSRSETGPASAGNRSGPSRAPGRQKARSPAQRARRGRAFSARHFTLFVKFASTKKQGLRVAIGARAGPSTVRNRAKRQAREAYRLSRGGLPEGVDLVITSTKGITELTRRRMREQLTELFNRARALLSPGGADGTIGA